MYTESKLMSIDNSVLGINGITKIRVKHSSGEVTAGEIKWDHPKVLQPVSSWWSIGIKPISVSINAK